MVTKPMVWSIPRWIPFTHSPEVVSPLLVVSTSPTEALRMGTYAHNTLKGVS